jgi:hypothetical protein
MTEQPAAERRAAEARRLIATYAPAHRGLIVAMRRGLKTRLPTAHEIVYEYRDWFVFSYSPNANGYDGVLGLRASAEGVKLYFIRGKGMPDPEKLLRGSASLVRFIEIESAKILARPAVAALIDEALARNSIPFAPDGRGPVVIRAAAKPKPALARK